MPIEEKRVTMESEIFLTIEAKYKDKKIDEESQHENQTVIKGMQTSEDSSTIGDGAVSCCHNMMLVVQVS